MVFWRKRSWLWKNTLQSLPLSCCSHCSSCYSTSFKEKNPPDSNSAALKPLELNSCLIKTSGEWAVERHRAVFALCGITSSLKPRQTHPLHSTGIIRKITQTSSFFTGNTPTKAGKKKLVYTQKLVRFLKDKNQKIIDKLPSLDVQQLSRPTVKCSLTSLWQAAYSKAPPTRGSRPIRCMTVSGATPKCIQQPISALISSLSDTEGGLLFILKNYGIIGNIGNSTNN